MIQSAWKGIVKGKKIVLSEEVKLPDGAEVLVTPLEEVKGTPQAVLAAMNAFPHLQPQDVEELRCMIAEGKRPVRFTNPLMRRR